MTKMQVIDGYSSQEDAKKGLKKFLDDNNVELVSYDIVRSQDAQYEVTAESKIRMMQYEQDWDTWADSLASLNPFARKYPSPELPISEYEIVREEKWRLEIIYNLLNKKIL